MLIERHATPLEKAADAAWDEYAAAAGEARASWGDDRYTSRDRRLLHERAISAHSRFADAYRLLNEPTPEPLRVESGRLYAEGLVLLSLVGLFVVLFLPKVLPGLIPLLISVFLGVGFGAWATSFLARLAVHLGRRL